MSSQDLGAIADRYSAALFDLAAADGSRLRLSELLARGPLVVYFYPKDDTPVCTAEACSFRDAYAAFTNFGAQVIGISSDAAASHASFAQRHGLPFPLASDSGGTLRKAFGVPKTLGLLPGRVTYVIDRAGIVRSVFNSMFDAQKHVDAALDALSALT